MTLQIHDHLSAAARARAWLEQDPLFLDTETTGVDNFDEIVELAIADKTGSLLINSLVRPAITIPKRAIAIHGIHNEDVAGAPTMIDLYPQVRALLEGRMVVVYNAAFDSRLLYQSLMQRGCDAQMLLPFAQNPGLGWQCAMLTYAEFYGDWNSWHGNYAWQKLGVAARQCNITPTAGLHRAAADADLCRQIVIHMAERSE